MTLQEIINYVDRKFPNSETDANKIIDLNRIYSEVFLALRRLTNTYSVDTSDVTVADQAEYDLPSGVQIEDIIKLEVETSNGSGEYDTFEYAGLQDEILYRKVFMRGSTSSKYYLYDDETALTTADRTIKISHYTRPETFSVGALGNTPAIDEEYHSLLCFGLIVELANQGDIPYEDTANYYQAKYDEFMRLAKRELEDRATFVGRTQRQEVKEWF